LYSSRREIWLFARANAGIYGFEARFWLTTHGVIASPRNYLHLLRSFYFKRKNSQTKWLLLHAPELVCLSNLISIHATRKSWRNTYIVTRPLHNPTTPPHLPHSPLPLTHTTRQLQAPRRRRRPIRAHTQQENHSQHLQAAQHQSNDWPRRQTQSHCDSYDDHNGQEAAHKDGESG
jgi:hypothetical protein